MYPFFHLVLEIKVGWEEQIWHVNKHLQSMQMSEAEQFKKYFPTKGKQEFKCNWNDN